MMAGFMALNALAIDSMLPALPAIGDSFDIASDNRRQWVVTAYLLGFGVAQIVYGPFSDRYGRRPVLFFGIALYIVASVSTAFAGSFDAMLLMRFVQGLGAAAGRVIVVAIVRDCYSGRRMASVMSLTLIVFLAAPALAPSIGQLILLFGPWQWIFIGLALLTALLLVWAWLKLPETLTPEDRLPLTFRRVLESFRQVATERMSVGYTMAMMFMLGSLFGFINSAQQIFTDVFGIGSRFPILFAAIAVSMAIASFGNSRIVERVGTRRLSHGALIGFTILSAISLVLEVLGFENLASFTVFQCLLFFCFGLTAPNFGAMAMEPVGRIAGSASSVQGFVTTLGGALLGFAIGQQFDGSTRALHCGFLLLSVLALGVVLIAEGRLFGERHGT